MLTPDAVFLTSTRMSSGVACSRVSTASSTSCRCGVSRYPRCRRSLFQSVPSALLPVLLRVLTTPESLELLEEGDPVVRHVVREGLGPAFDVLRGHDLLELGGHVG